MSERNDSRATEFILTGFPGLHPEYYGLVSALLFFMYLMTVIANASVLLLFATNRCLHKPVYYIILNVSVCDLLFSTTTLPKIISRYWFKSGSISFFGCFVQMFFVHYLGSVNSFIFFLMAFDRYCAICHPLKYTVVLKNINTHIFSLTAWMIASPLPLMLVIRAYPLPYCGPNVISHCFCDHIGITVLACTDRALYAVPAFISAMITLLVPLAFIVFSYCSILMEVSKIAGWKNRLKSLSTCSTQLIIISLYYLPRCFVYLSSVVGISFRADVRIVIIMLYSLGPPMVNPLIYCLRAKDIRECLWKQFYRIVPPTSFKPSGLTIGWGFSVCFSADVRIVIVMLYSLVPPMVNPLIYCLRAKDIRLCLWKQFYRIVPPKESAGDKPSPSA
ncbi:putative olfactory receptor 10D4 [Austrofundulus limnaeus]|uniref:Olfactory receptor 10D4 n=1 Tax=Austrofundulus limnaeus TaxID=52670 RepID=A0A2I4BP55_AUSLI|nr:PREDICTED: putative olfactory receptor 10D4 [Austrofundulus limnaeus]